MSLLSIKDFAKIAGVKIGTLRKHITRGKIVKTGKHIDTDDPQNVFYLNEQWVKNGKPKQDPKELAEIEGKTAFEKAPIEIVGNSISVKDENWVLRKKKADALKAEREAEYKQLQIQKMQGQLMPMELVEKIFIINIQGVFRSFEASAENIASIYTEKLGGNRADLADMITRMREELDRAIKSAKQKSKEEIKALMVEYAATRSRGEKK